VFDVSVFRIDFDDKIEQIQVNIADVERINSGDSRHQGIEFSVEYDLLPSESHSLKLFANGSLLDTEIRNSENPDLVGNDAAFAPRHLIRTGLLYDSEKWNAALTATLVGEQYWQDSNQARGFGANEIEAEIPDYQVLDFSVEHRASDKWTVFGGINNLLDEEYYSRVRNDGIEPAMERTFYVGLRLEIK
jgi:Fe(3+) dicitrate transport protein